MISYSIRHYQKSDLADLMRIYKDAVNAIGLEQYTPEQVEAWSSFGNDTPAFETWLEESTVYIAMDTEMKAVGFAGLESGGRIASLFVAPGYMRQGIGGKLLQHILKEAASRGLTQFTTDASEFSRPVFETAGFSVKEIEDSCFKGVQFQRYKMIRDNSTQE